MIWKNKYKRRRKRKFFDKIQKLNFKVRNNNYNRIILWTFMALIIYSIISHNFLNQKKENHSREWNRNQIKELNLEELYKLKNLDHHDVRLWILNSSTQNGLAAKIAECLLKGYYENDKHIKGDYNILKQDNYNKIDQYDMGYMNGLKTEIFVHVDTVNYPKFKEHLKEFLSFTGYAQDIVKYNYQKKLYEERDITIILGEDWDEAGNLIQCDNPIN